MPSDAELSTYIIKIVLNKVDVIKNESEKSGWMCRAAGGELCRGEGQRSGAGKQQRGLQRPDRLFKLFLAHFEAAFDKFDTKSWLA